MSAEYLNSYAAVYVDGKQAGEIRFPGGEVDLTSACRPGGKHVLSMLVVAMPLKGCYAFVQRYCLGQRGEGFAWRDAGLCGDVYLVSTPRGPHRRCEGGYFGAQGEITFDAALQGLDPGRSIHAARPDHGQRAQRQGVHQHSHSRRSDLKDGRIAFTEKWKPDKLWDIHTPQNMFNLQLSLLDAGGKVLDTVHDRALRVPRVLD